MVWFNQWLLPWVMYIENDGLIKLLYIVNSDVFWKWWLNQSSLYMSLIMYFESECVSKSMHNETNDIFWKWGFL